LDESLSANAAASRAHSRLARIAGRVFALPIAAVAVLLYMSIQTPAEAAQATLRWDYTASGASGFALHCGASSGSYTSRIDVGNTDTYTLTNLVAGSTRYCVVTAYDSARVESAFSNEVTVSVASDAPVVNFSATPTSGTAPLTVTFTNQSSGQVTNWLWDFGDGTSSTAQSPSHTYSSAGSYAPRLTATGPGGTASRTATTAISVGTGGTTTPPLEIIVDNGQAQMTSFAGTWCTSTATGAYGASSLYSCGSGLDTYRWRPTVGTAATYDVFVRWTANSTRSTTVPITVASQGVAQTFLRNQRVGGSRWQLLGRFPFAAGTTGYVEVSDRNGQAGADAVRLSRVPPGDILLDNGQAGTSATGSWCASSAANGVGTNSLYSCGSGTDTYRWTPTLAAAGSYDVYVWWTANSTRSTSVPITVVSSSGAQTFTRNQQTAGGQWQLLGTFSFSAGATGYVEVSDRNGQAGADAVRFARR
jgi:PKD repeat protein